MSGQGYNFHGAKAEKMAKRLGKLKRNPSLRAFPETRTRYCTFCDQARAAINCFECGNPTR